MTLFGTQTKKSRLRAAVGRRRVRGETAVSRQERDRSGESRKGRRVQLPRGGGGRFAGHSRRRSRSHVREADDLVQRVPVQIRLDARGARGLRRNTRQAEDSAAGHPALPGELRGRQEVPDGRVPLREAVGWPAQLPESFRTRLLQRHLADAERLFLLPAGHRVCPARASASPSWSASPPR